MSKTFEYDLGMYEEKPYSPLIQGDTQELDELIMQRTDAYMGTKEFATLESAVEEAIEAKNPKKDIRDCTGSFIKHFLVLNFSCIFYAALFHSFFKFYFNFFIR